MSDGGAILNQLHRVSDKLQTKRCEEFAARLVAARAASLGVLHHTMAFALAVERETVEAVAAPRRE